MNAVVGSTTSSLSQNVAIIYTVITEVMSSPDVSKTISFAVPNSFGGGYVPIMFGNGSRNNASLSAFERQSWTRVGGSISYSYRNITGAAIIYTLPTEVMHSRMAFSVCCSVLEGWQRPMSTKRGSLVNPAGIIDRPRSLQGMRCGSEVDLMVTNSALLGNLEERGCHKVFRWPFLYCVSYAQHSVDIGIAAQDRLFLKAMQRGVALVCRTMKALSCEMVRVVEDATRFEPTYEVDKPLLTARASSKDR